MNELLVTYACACECNLTVACDEGEFRTRESRKQVQQCINGKWMNVVCSSPTSTLTPTPSSSIHPTLNSTTITPIRNTEPTETQSASTELISLSWYRVIIGVFGVLVLLTCPGFFIACGIALYQHKQIQQLNNETPLPHNEREHERRLDLHIPNPNFQERRPPRQPEEGDTERSDGSPTYESIRNPSPNDSDNQVQTSNGYDDMARELTIRQEAQAP